MKSLFVNENITYKEHFGNHMKSYQILIFKDAQNDHYDLYMAVLLLLLNQGVEISKGSRPRVLASAWARHDKQLSTLLLSLEDTFALPAVLGALNLLDAARKVRSVEKKIDRLEKQVKGERYKMLMFRERLRQRKWDS
jgi:uncharacterized membrane protein YciS (DUF1049 family)